MKLIKVFSYVLALAIISGCTNHVKPGEYDAAEIGKIKKVVTGVIVSKRPVKFRSTQHTEETAIGQGVMTPSRGFEYVIKLGNGEIIAIAQAEDLKLKLRQHVLLIQGENTHIVPDHGSEDY
jgi:outer membrane lipoprotein SlyB